MAGKILKKRRQFNRYTMKSGATVLLIKPRFINIGKPRHIELGPIIDISMGGLSVQYIDSKQRSKEYFELSISIVSNGIILFNIPFKTVSDTIMSSLPNGTEIKKRSIQFEKLSDQQKFSLNKFIDEYANVVLEDRRINSDRRRHRIQVQEERRTGSERRKKNR